MHCLSILSSPRHHLLLLAILAVAGLNQNQLVASVPCYICEWIHPVLRTVPSAANGQDPCHPNRFDPSRVFVKTCKHGCRTLVTSGTFGNANATLFPKPKMIGHSGTLSTVKFSFLKMNTLNQSVFPSILVRECAVKPIVMPFPYCTERLSSGGRVENTVELQCDCNTPLCNVEALKSLSSRFIPEIVFLLFVMILNKKWLTCFK